MNNLINTDLNLQGINKVYMSVFYISNFDINLRLLMKRIFNGIKTYLTDWKNLLMHSIVGILIVIIALFAPVSPYLRLGFVVIVIGFNVIRMRYKPDLFSINR